MTRPIRVLRVIARLNVGGPALHVTYLTRGLAERGYETTLVAGDVARGEESMAFVAERSGVSVVPLPGLSREIRTKLDTVRPRTLGQAARIEGMTPAAITLLAAHVRKRTEALPEAAETDRFP